MKIEVTKLEHDLIREALMVLFYIAKDDGDERKMNRVANLEVSLSNQESSNPPQTQTMLFSNNQEKAKEKILQLIEQSGDKIVREYKSSDIITIYTESSRYTSRHMGDSARGYRYTEVYIDKEDVVRDDFSRLYYEVIIPKLITRPTESNMEDENYRWYDHVHYF